MFKSITLVVAMVFMVVSVSGCASKYGKQETVVAYYPACYDPIQKLRDDESSVTTSTAGGAVVGGLLGALVGGLATGKVEGALMGAAGGAVAGGVAGHAVSTRQKSMDENARMAQYLSDLDGDIAGLDIVSASARTSLQCYERQFKSLIAGFKAKRITKAQLQSMYSEIQSGTREATKLLGTAEANGRDLERQYKEALAHENDVLVASAPVQKGNPRKAAITNSQSRDSLKKAQHKTTQLSKKVDQIAEEKQAAEKRETAQSQEVRDLIAASVA